MDSIQPVVCQCVPLAVRRTGRESDHSPLSSDEVENTWSYTFTPPIRLNGVELNWVQDTPAWRGTSLSTSTLPLPWSYTRVYPKVSGLNHYKIYIYN